VVSCDLSLEGELVVEQACDGDVQLNSAPLPCDGEHGWSAVDPSTIRLRGDACELWKTSATASLEATFPCEAVIPLL
jgi:hypothetical protein